MKYTYKYKLVQITQFKVQDRLLSENKPKSFDLLTFLLYFKRVPEEGLEPSLHYWKRILSPQRLPFRHSGKYKDRLYKLMDEKNRVNSRYSVLRKESRHLKI